jgi:hypothetical protein
VGLVAGKPHMIAILLPIVALYGLFAWQVQRLLAPFASMAGSSSEQAHLLVLVAGLTFGMTVASTWFLARQTITVTVPATLRAMPFMSYTWLRAQSALFIVAIWLLNNVVALPLFVALGRQYHVPLAPWLAFVELALLLYILIGLICYLLTEQVVHLRRFRKISGSLSNLHTIGQVGIVAFVGYGRLFTGGILNRMNIGWEAKHFMSHHGLGRLLALGVLIVVIVVAIAILHGLSRGFRTLFIERRATKPLSARLFTTPRGKREALIITAWRIMLSDKEVTMPNFLIIAVIAVAAFGVRTQALSATSGLVLYSLYNVLFLLLFASWALSARGRLGGSRSVVYGLPLEASNFVRTLGVIVVTSIVGLYAITESSLFLIMGNSVGESWGNIGKNILMLLMVTSLTFMLGVVTYVGQKNGLNQVPVAVAFTVTNVLGLVLMAWVHGKYGVMPLFVVAFASAAAAILLAARYERDHLLDEV